MPDEETKDICEICQMEIILGAPQVRVVGDAMIASTPTKYDSIIENKVVVFASFHCSCLDDAEGDELMDDVPYIWEARALREATSMSTPALVEEDRRKHLKLLQGGIR